MKKAYGDTMTFGTESKKIGGFDMSTDDNAPMPPPLAGAFGPVAGTVSCSTDLGGARDTYGEALTGTFSQPFTLGMEAQPQWPQ